MAQARPAAEEQLPPEDRRRRLVVTGVPAAVAIGVLLVVAAGYLPFVADDALISLRYARNLLGGRGLVWTEGPPVEGYSNLLWVLACAAGGLFHADLILVARALGALGMAAAIAAVAWASAPRASVVAELAGATAGALTLALSGSIAVYVVAGMEQPLVAALLAWAIALARPLHPRADTPTDRSGATAAAGACLAGLVLTRVDGFVLAGAVALGFALGQPLLRSRVRRLVPLAALPAAAWLAQQAFRMAYYGDVVPNTARVKVAFTSHRLATGLDYLVGGLAPAWPVILLALVGSLAGVRRPEVRPRVVLASVVAAAWGSYVCVIGGDIFPGRRHLVPLVVALAFLAAEGVAWAVAGGGTRRRWLAAAGAAACLGLFALQQQRDPENRRAREEVWEWDGALLGDLLKAAFGGRQALIAVDPAGCVPYFSELATIDMMGLNDRWIATHPPSTAGTGRIGHEFGDGRYVLSRRPDIVLFCSPAGSEGPCFRSGEEMFREAEFHEHYRLVNVQPRPDVRFVSQLWVRQTSEKVGVRPTDAGAEVPVYLLAAGTRAVALWTAERTWEVHVADQESVYAAGLALPPGSYEVRIDSTPAVGLAVADGDEWTSLPPEGEGRWRLAVRDEPRSPTSLRLTTSALTRIRSLRLRRGDVRY